MESDYDLNRIDFIQVISYNIKSAQYDNQTKTDDEAVMRLKFFATALTSILLTALLAFFIVRCRDSSIAGYVEEYQKISYKTERLFVENVPVYRDFAKPALVAELQRYDLPQHARQVVKHGTIPLKNIDDINSYVKDGKLVALSSGTGSLYYFHNVQKEYRYLTPGAGDGLKTVAERFQQKLKSHNGDLPVVKLAVSSVIRTVDYQEKIFGRKFVSLHSYGGCFDIFFDDYYVQLPEPDKSGGVYDRIKKSLQARTGYLMGDALREQFRSVLMETLLELQREGVLYAFLEDGRRCYHITILAKER